MGMIRFCLALAVVYQHAHLMVDGGMIDGFTAVKVFFVISGFYMGLIINEKYAARTNAYWLFITNRALRLYPVYIAAFVLSLVVFIACKDLPNSFGHNYTIAGHNPYTYLLQNGSYFFEHWGILLYTVVANVFIIGLEIPYFIHMKAVQIVPQAWTLSLEFVFYFLAPFLVRLNGRILGALIILSIALRYILLQSGFVQDPWPYRFFPTESVFFLLGIVSYKIYSRIKWSWINKPLFVLSMVLILGPVVSWPVFMKYLYGPWAWGNDAIAYALYFSAVTIGIPIVFWVSKSNLFDRWLGEYSYPIYVIHFAVIYFVSNVLKVRLERPVLLLRSF